MRLWAWVAGRRRVGRSAAAKRLPASEMDDRVADMVRVKSVATAATDRSRKLVVSGHRKAEARERGRRISTGLG